MGIWCDGLAPKSPAGQKFNLPREAMEEMRSLAEEPPVGEPDPDSDECWLYSEVDCRTWAIQLEQAAVRHLAGLPTPRTLPDVRRFWLVMDFARFLKESGGIRHDF